MQTNVVDCRKRSEMWFQPLILGLIQGLTEFLPVSSSAHLFLIPHYLGWEDPGLAFDVALHLGTLAGVLVYFWADIRRLLEAVLNPGDSRRAQDRRLALFLILATVPGALAGLAFEHKIETVFRSALIIALAMMALGLFLGLADWFCRGDKKAADLSIGTAIGLGIAQAFALIPGVSRSGVTITVARALGLERREAARFSFLMSVPIIAGAGILKIRQIIHSPDKAALAVGFSAAALSGLFAIWLLMRYVQGNRYTPFVIYRWAVGIFVLFNLAHFK